MNARKRGNRKGKSSKVTVTETVKDQPKHNTIMFKFMSALYKLVVAAASLAIALMTAATLASAILDYMYQTAMSIVTRNAKAPASNEGLQRFAQLASTESAAFAGGAVALVLVGVTVGLYKLIMRLSEKVMVHLRNRESGDGSDRLITSDITSIREKLSFKRRRKAQADDKQTDSGATSA